MAADKIIKIISIEQYRTNFTSSLVVMVENFPMVEFYWSAIGLYFKQQIINIPYLDKNKIIFSLEMH